VKLLPAASWIEPRLRRFGLFANRLQRFPFNRLH
jgi:hypothetical protein